MEDRTTEIFTMNPDGSNQVQITNDDLELKREVIWSPDSSMMLFLTYQGRALSRLYSVYSMFSDGSGTTLLTETVRFNPMPTWID
jgi:Tol biopolymer transport system component